MLAGEHHAGQRIGYGSHEPGAAGGIPGSALVTCAALQQSADWSEGKMERRQSKRERAKLYLLYQRYNAVLLPRSVSNCLI